MMVRETWRDGGSDRGVSPLWVVSRGDGGVVVVVVMAQILNMENWGDYFTSYTHCGLTS